MSIRVTSIVLTLILTGCASGPVPPTGAATTTPSEPTIPSAPAPQPGEARLTPDLIYDTLVGEIANQRGDSQTAFQHAYRAALQSRNPGMAQRASRLALLSNQHQNTEKALTLWIELEPDSLKAHQIAALLHAKHNADSKTLFHLKRVAELANQQGKFGYLQAAAIAEKSNTPGKALALMQQITAGQQQNPAALYALAVTANHAKRHDIAEQQVRTALNLKPGWPQARLLLARTLILQGNPDAGLNELKAAVADNPSDKKLRTTLARTLLEQNQTEQARAHFIKLHQQSPENADIGYALGVLSTQLKHYDEAKEYFTSLIEHGQKKDDAHYYLGLINEIQEQHDNAISHYQQVSGGGNQIDARIRTARLLTNKGEIKRARELLQRLRLRTPQHQLRINLIEAELLRSTGDFASAMEIYNTALKADPDNLDLLYARGINAADLGAIEQMERDLQRILDKDPNHADALNALGYTLADKTKRLHEAKRYIERALALQPDNPAILDSIGWVEYRMGNVEQARHHLEQAAQQSKDAEIAAHLGEVLWQLGQHREALQIWQEAMQREPRNRFIRPVRKRLTGSEQGRLPQSK
jgi:tetratricopeptide (TPR) repeat protein